MNDAPRRCPAASRIGACREAPACASDPDAVVPREGVVRAVILTLRFVAAAAETGDAACWEAAFDRAEDELGPRDGALLVARAGALLRALWREGAIVRFLPPPCRRLSAGEADLLAALAARLNGALEARLNGALEARLNGALAARLNGERAAGAYGASPGTRAAFADLVAPLLAARRPVALAAIPVGIGHPSSWSIL